ncbi:hypothetical protein QBC40DRAFT_296731 [Triangularia verruculosa]|uniref:Uncharacterized protein n=1 Tax=Triangularia verruculosa TaxID=2587418 RepID=A0AAN6XHH0_9PEZI|nr:hypothetical protein QBC40DRAFT_296731 [Triangularia verruculosa]
MTNKRRFRIVCETTPINIGGLIQRQPESQLHASQEPIPRSLWQVGYAMALRIWSVQTPEWKVYPLQAPIYPLMLSFTPGTGNFRANRFLEAPGETIWYTPEQGQEKEILVFSITLFLSEYRVVDTNVPTPEDRTAASQATITLARSIAEPRQEIIKTKDKIHQTHVSPRGVPWNEVLIYDGDNSKVVTYRTIQRRAKVSIDRTEIDYFTHAGFLLDNVEQLCEENDLDANTIQVTLAALGPTDRRRPAAEWVRHILRKIDHLDDVVDNAIAAADNLPSSEKLACLKREARHPELEKVYMKEGECLNFDVGTIKSLSPQDGCVQRKGDLLEIDENDSAAGESSNRHLLKQEEESEEPDSSWARVPVEQIGYLVTYR